MPFSAHSGFWDVWIAVFPQQMFWDVWIAVYEATHFYMVPMPNVSGATVRSIRKVSRRRFLSACVSQCMYTS